MPVPEGPTDTIVFELSASADAVAGRCSEIQAASGCIMRPDMRCRTREHKRCAIADEDGRLARIGLDRHLRAGWMDNAGVKLDPGGRASREILRLRVRALRDDRREQHVRAKHHGVLIPIGMRIVREIMEERADDR